MSKLITSDMKAKVIGSLERLYNAGYNVGYNVGKKDGIEEGIEEGKVLDNEYVRQEGYNVGYAAGKKEGEAEGIASMIDESKIIEKTATGTGVVALDDVSELPHDITVQLSGENVAGKTVTVYGKNLFDQSQELKVVRTTDTKTYYGYSLDLPAGRYTISAKKIVEDERDVFIYLVPPHEICLNPYPRLVTPTEHRTLVVDVEEGNPLRIYDGYGAGLTFAEKVFAKVAIQVEVGGNSSPYEEYMEPAVYDANADGTVNINSLSPTMTILCNGVDMSVNYRADWGITTEREKQWNGFTNNGTRTSFPYAFAIGFDDGIFRPFTDVNVEGTGSSYMFYNSKILDLAGAFKKYGTKLNTSAAGSLHSMFYAAKTLVVPEISLVGITSASGTNNMFASSEIRIIEKLIFNDEGTTPIASSMFTNATNLVHIGVEGVIGQNLNISACPLDRESMDNILAHLKIFGTVWTETDKRNWELGNYENGVYPFDKVKVVLKEVPENVTEYYVFGGMSDNEGGTNWDIHFDENGEADISQHVVGYTDAGGESSEIYAIITPNDEALSPTSYAVYEGKVFDESTEEKKVTFKQSAVDTAYTDEEWRAKVFEAQNKGWTVATTT